MIHLISYFAEGSGLYTVNIDTAFTLTIVYLVPFLMMLLIREFTKGLLRYSLAALFMLSFGGLWYVLEIENSPWQFILPGVVILGVAAGLSGLIRHLLNMLK